jgi:hypothetical protein
MIGACPLCGSRSWRFASYAGAMGAAYAFYASPCGYVTAPEVIDAENGRKVFRVTA